MDLFERNHIGIGMALAMISPIAGFGLIYLIFGLLAHLGIMDTADLELNGRVRTMVILAICTNIIWIKKFNQPFTLQTLRGIILITMILSAAWFFLYYDTLYAS